MEAVVPIAAGRPALLGCEGAMRTRVGASADRWRALAVVGAGSVGAVRLRGGGREGGPWGGGWRCERRSGPAESVAPREVLRLGLAKWRRRRLAVQVLGGDRAPIGSGAELTEHDGDDRVRSADHDRLGR